MTTITRDFAKSNASVAGTSKSPHQPAARKGSDDDLTQSREGAEKNVQDNPSIRDDRTAIELFVASIACWDTTTLAMLRKKTTR